MVVTHVKDHPTERHEQVV